MGYCKNVRLWGRHYGPLCNFLVSGSIMKKYGVVRQFDKFTPKSPQNYCGVWRHFCFSAPILLKFRNSLFLDRCRLNLAQDTNSEATFYIRVGHFLRCSLRKRNKHAFDNNRVAMATNQAKMNKTYIFGCSIHWLSYLRCRYCRW